MAALIAAGQVTNSGSLIDLLHVLVDTNRADGGLGNDGLGVLDVRFSLRRRISAASLGCELITEGCVPEDWAAVAEAITTRARELGWQQRELARRSQVSPAIVREIQGHTVERRRSSRTLEALSIALGWHPQHLDAVVRGRRPPQVDESVCS